LAGALLFDEKRTILYFPRIFGDWFGGKECGLCTYNPCAREEGGLEGYLNEAAQNFKLFSNI
jgi:hypothetical protein